MTLFMALIIFLLESAAFDTKKPEPYDLRRSDKAITEPGDFLAHRIFTIVQPDSLQAQQIKSLTGYTAQRIKSIHHSSRKERKLMIDSLRAQLRPILTDDQFKRLESVALHMGRNSE